MKIYENVVIGNFLYSLGWAVSAKNNGKPFHSIVNLLQQTPSDKLLGDLLLEFPGVVRLLEFKTKENKSNKEHARHLALTAAINAEPHLKDISRRVHWYVESALDKKNNFVVRVAPYLVAFPREQPTDLLQDYIEILATDITSSSFNEQDRTDEKAYLNWVKLLQGEGHIGTGGLCVIANSDGSIHYAQVADIMELRMEHREWIAMHEKQLQFDLQPQITPSRENELQLEKKSRGISR